MSQKTVNTHIAKFLRQKAAQIGGPIPPRNNAPTYTAVGGPMPTYNTEAARAFSDMYGPAVKSVGNFFGGLGSGLAGGAKDVASSLIVPAGRSAVSGVSGTADALTYPVRHAAEGVSNLGSGISRATASLLGPRKQLALTEAGQADAQSYNAANVLKYLLMGAGGGLGLGGLLALAKQTKSEDDDNDVYYESPLTVGDTLSKLKKRRRPEGLFRKESGDTTTKVGNFFNVTMHPADLSKPKERSTAPDMNWGDFAFPLAAAGAIPTFLSVRDFMEKKQKEIKKKEQQAELDEAQKQFDTARALQYEAVMRRKTSSEHQEQVKQGLDAATFLSPVTRVWQDAWGGLSNAVTGRDAQPTSAGFKDYLVGALIASLGAHYAGRRVGSSLTTDKSGDDIKKRVLRERRAQLAASPYSALPMVSVDIPYKTDMVDAESVLPKLD